MTRAYDDKTSTCESCTYWARDSTADGLHPTAVGDCGWLSMPAWTRTYIPLRASSAMRAEAGLDCWQHTKRDASPAPSVLEALRDFRLSHCGRDTGPLVCPSCRKADAAIAGASK